MEDGGAPLALMEIIGPILLLVVIIFVVLRVRSKGKESSPRRTEEATRELYAEEDRRDEERP